MRNANEFYSRLCRMIMINAGTNKHAPSGRITEIDPRGGAAITGANGVGKTTTLHILPLFFGYSYASSGRAVSQNRENIIHFILPTPQSAIVFEYQRGSNDESGLRLAVLRHDSEGERAKTFYRLLRCGFRRELFIDEGRFLTDEEMMERAAKLGIEASIMLSYSEYRCAILGTPFLSNDKKRSRYLASTYSFSDRPLENLDRIVASMVKKRVSFDDIVQVVMGLARNEIADEVEGRQLVFQQGKEFINKWIRDYRACSEALQKSGEVRKLEESLQKHRNELKRLEDHYRRAAVLRNRVHKELELLDEEWRVFEQKRRDEEKEEQERMKALNDEAQRCRKIAEDAEFAATQAKKEADYLESEKAREWAARVMELPALWTRLNETRERIEAAVASRKDEIARYERLKMKAQNDASQEIIGLKDEKEKRSRETEERIERLEREKAKKLKEHDEELSKALRPLNGEREQLLQQRGALDNARRSPSVDEKLLRSLEQAQEQERHMYENVVQARQQLEERKREHKEALREFDDLETRLRWAEKELEAAEEEVRRAEAALAPPEKTLLAAIFANGGGRAHQALVRIINPALLYRQDLSPEFVDDGAQSAYGWNIDTSVIPMPAWALEDHARHAVEEAHGKRARKQEALRLLKEKLESQNRSVKEASSRVAEAEANLSVARSRHEESKAGLEKAKALVEDERRKAAKKAEEELKQLERQLAEKETQIREVEFRHRQERINIENRFEQEKSFLRQELNRVHGEIDALIQNRQKQRDDSIRKIEEDLAACLEEKGINSQRLLAMENEEKAIEKEIRLLESKSALARSWEEWQKSNGPEKLRGLIEEAERAKRSRKEAEEACRRHQERMYESRKRHEQQARGIESRHNRLSEDIRILDALLEQGRSRFPLVDHNTEQDDAALPTVSEIKSLIEVTRVSISSTERDIKERTRLLKSELTLHEGGVKDLIESKLSQCEKTDGGNDEEDFIRQARALCEGYQQIGPQVVTKLHVDLKTIFEGVSTFQDRLKKFEREIAKFNRDLQKGLEGVKRFERIDDLHLNIKTNLDQIDFYRSLEQVVQAYFEYEINNESSDVRSLPSAKIKTVLGDFVNVLGANGNIAVDLDRHVVLSGSLNDNGRIKHFRSANELQNISSEGLTTLVLITLMVALVNTVRGTSPVYVPWVTDEANRFDASNFKALMHWLRDNYIDVIVAAPEINPAQRNLFANRYFFEDGGCVSVYCAPDEATVKKQALEAA